MEPQDTALHWDMECAFLMPLVEFSRVNALGWLKIRVKCMIDMIITIGTMHSKCMRN